jgi:anaerobic dimethyl sulfoxide reductase subunit C (anchor subunit)
MHGNHWSLIIFTLLAQTAAGTIILGSIGRHLFKNSARPFTTEPVFRRSLILSSALMLTAASASFFHLGTPLHAIYVLGNLGASWLSREILSVIMFTGILCLWTLLYITGFNRRKMFTILEGATVVLGLILVFSMSRIYMLQTVPVWNHMYTPLAFYASAFLLGTAVWLLMTGLSSKTHTVPIERLGILGTIFGVSQLAILIFSVLHLNRLQIELTGGWLLGIRFVSLLIGTVLAANVKSRDNRPRLFLVVFFFVITEILGRYLFYAAYTRIGI